MALRLRRGTEAERVSVIFQEGELVYVTDTKDLYAGDGVTPGGIKVSNVGSPDALTQNLDLDGFNILGNGTVTATAFIGDGSGLTNLPIGPGGILEGVDYRINIVGLDSSTIVNSNTNTLTGVFVGDGSNITNILLEQLDDALILSPSNGEVLTYQDGFWINGVGSGGTGIVEGGNYRINITGVDSTRIVDSDNNEITVNKLNTSDQFFEISYNTPGQSTNVKVVSEDRQSIFKVVRTSTTTDLSIDDTIYGSIYFEREDNNGPATPTIIAGGSDRLIFAVDDGSNTFPNSNVVVLNKLGFVGFGTYTPSTKLELVDGSLRFNESRTIASITSPTFGEMTINTSNNKLTFYDGFEWRELVSTSTLSNATDVSGVFVLGGITDAEKIAFGEDSVDITGAMIYNSTTDRFEFFQAGSWITMANQELDEASDVRFNSVTADSFISTGAGTPTLESATNLDLQAGNAVRVIGAPFRLANLTTTERNALTAANGDMIYNTTANRIQAYQNGAWINLDDGTAG